MPGTAHIPNYVNNAKEVRGRMLRAREAEKRKTLQAEIEAEFGLPVRPINGMSWRPLGEISVRKRF